MRNITSGSTLVQAGCAVSVGAAAGLAMPGSSLAVAVPFALAAAAGAAKSGTT